MSGSTVSFEDVVFEESLIDFYSQESSYQGQRTDSGSFTLE